MTDRSDDRADEPWTGWSGDLEDDRTADRVAWAADSAEVDADRKWARKRLERKRELLNHLVIYAVVNAFLVGVWAFTGGGYFWPGWVMLGWGVFFALDASELMYRRGITDADIDRELRRHNK